MARFLVVDHDPQAVTALSKLLASDGHEVVPQTHTESAIQALVGEAFDAVVTDAERCVLDGHAIVRVTRDRHPAACLIVVTSRGEENSEALIEAGACIVRDKPLEYEKLVQEVTLCRARGGPGAHGRCHMKPTASQFLQLHRR